MPFTGRNLILIIGGSLQPGEGLKGYLRRVSQEVGVGFRSLQLAWRGTYQSKKTQEILHSTASEKRKNDVQRLIEETVWQIMLWEKLDRERNRNRIDAARAYIVALRETDIDASVSGGNEDGS